MCHAVDIADYILNHAARCQYEITNLQLQKILYYVQLNFLRKYNKVAFDDPILALRHGPCIISVYDKFHIWGRYSIQIQEHLVDLDMVQEEKELIKQVVDASMLLSSVELTERAQKKDGPWDQTFWNGGEVIKVDLMRNYVKEKGHF